MSRGGALALLTLLFALSVAAEDAFVAGASIERVDGGTGGGASVLWIRDSWSTGATLMSLPGTRWAYGTVGAHRRLTPRMVVHGEANLGAGKDAAGRFRYILLRGGVTREVLPKRLYAEAEWLQTDVARQQDGIARVGGAFVPRPRLTLRASLFQSLVGDNDTTLATLRGDYDLPRVTAIAGFSGGTAVPALLQQSGSVATRVREAFAGVAFGAVSRRWTVLVTSGEDRQRLSVTCRIALP